MTDIKKPKILIISRNVWDDLSGNSSTLSSVFSEYEPEQLAHIYIETKKPSTDKCRVFFQISEFSLIKKLYRWKFKTGRAFNSNDSFEPDQFCAKHEASTMNFVREHRSFFFLILREFLWLLNGWKSKELKQFLTDYNPDVIWLDGSPLILMNRLYEYVLKLTNKPAVIFLMDDVYTFESCSGFSQKIYKLWLRKHVRRVIHLCKKVFVISPKMKREYDIIFGLNSSVLTKGIAPIQGFSVPEIHQPIRLVYLGQIFYGRLDTIMQIVDALQKVNKDIVRIDFYIYTNNVIPYNVQNYWQTLPFVHIENPVPYNDVPNVIQQNDVLLYVESFQKIQKRVARLSFSTKITDYLASGKCIMGIGPADIAPIEYLREENAAIIVSDLKQLESVLNDLSESQIVEYAKKAYMLGITNHSKEKMDSLVRTSLLELQNE